MDTINLDAENILSWL